MRIPRRAPMLRRTLPEIGTTLRHELDGLVRRASGWLDDHGALVGLIIIALVFSFVVALLRQGFIALFR